MQTKFYIFLITLIIFIFEVFYSYFSPVPLSAIVGLFVTLIGSLLAYYGDVRCNEKLLINHNINLLQDTQDSINFNEENSNIAVFKRLNYYHHLKLQRCLRDEIILSEWDIRNKCKIYSNGRKIADNTANIHMRYLDWVTNGGNDLDGEIIYRDIQELKKAANKLRGTVLIKRHLF